MIGLIVCWQLAWSQRIRTLVDLLVIALAIVAFDLGNIWL